jgi:hypothetical protein
MDSTEDLGTSSTLSDLRSTIEIQNELVKKIRDEKESLEVWKRDSEFTNRQLMQELKSKAQVNFSNPEHFCMNTSVQTNRPN